jgi:rod shape-determining protein MreD
MKYLSLAVFTCLALFLEGRITILGIAPDLTALLAFYVGMRYGETRGLLAGVVIGALEDSVSASIIGPNLLGKGIVGFSASFFVSGRLLRWTPLLGLIVVSLLTFADGFVVFLAKSVFDKVPAVPSTAFLVSIMQSVLNAPAGIFVRPKNAD